MLDSRAKWWRDIQIRVRTAFSKFFFVLFSEFFRIKLQFHLIISELDVLVFLSLSISEIKKGNIEEVRRICEISDSQSLGYNLLLSFHIAKKFN